MPGRDIVVIGASAGGIPLLTDFAKALPAKLKVAILLVIHTSPSSPGVLPALIARAGPFPAEFAKNGETIRPGRFYVASPDRHLLIKNGRISVTHGPKDNGFRPAVDPLFRSAAEAFGPRVVGIVLSGGLDDGTAGLYAIKQHGGIAIAQNPQEADFPSMPLSAIRNVAVDHIVPLAEIPHLLERYTADPLPQEPAMRARKEKPDIAERGDHGLEHHSVPGTSSNLTCPECGGALWQDKVSSQLRFQCHVGHLYTGDGLVADMDRDLEQSLWAAVRTMEEAAELRRRMAALAKDAPWKEVSPPYARQAAELERRANVIRGVLQSGIKGVESAKLRGLNPIKANKPSPNGRKKRRTDGH